MGLSFSNKEKALNFYNKASELGDSDALNRLGEIYDQGNDVIRDARIAE